MQLLLIRHAMNDWVGTRLAGWRPGVHLNRDGRAEAAALAARLASYPLQAIYASPLERAQETAAFVAGPHGLTVQTHAGIGEVRYGEWTGKHLKELRDDPLWPVVQVHPSGARFPGGETIAEVQSRAVAAVESMRLDHRDGVVAAVTHGDVVKTVVAHYIGMHIDLFQRLVVGTASVTVLRFTPHGPRLFAFNDKGGVPLPPQDDKDGPAAPEGGSDGR
jgi:probable phosphoglycerate mutase